MYVLKLTMPTSHDCACTVAPVLEAFQYPDTSGSPTIVKELVAKAVDINMSERITIAIDLGNRINAPILPILFLE